MTEHPRLPGELDEEEDSALWLLVLGAVLFSLIGYGAIHHFREGLAELRKPVHHHHNHR